MNRCLHKLYFNADTQTRRRRRRHKRKLIRPIQSSGAPVADQPHRERPELVRQRRLLPVQYEQVPRLAAHDERRATARQHHRVPLAVAVGGLPLEFVVAHRLRAEVRSSTRASAHNNRRHELAKWEQAGGIRPSGKRLVG